MATLEKYLQSIVRTEFVWGKHDCLTFTNHCWHILYGKGWSDDWLGGYVRPQSDRMKGLAGVKWTPSPKSKKVILREYGFSSVEEGVDSKLKRINHIPPRGALVAAKLSDAKSWHLGLAFGISMGQRAVFLHDVGIKQINVEDISAAWVNHE